MVASNVIYTSDRRSGPQGSVKPYTIIDDPAAWMAADYQHDESKWVYVLTKQDIKELDAAVAGVEHLLDSDIHVRCSSGVGGMLAAVLHTRDNCAA